MILELRLASESKRAGPRMSRMKLIGCSKGVGKNPATEHVTPSQGPAVVGPPDFCLMLPDNIKTSV